MSLGQYPLKGTNMHLLGSNKVQMCTFWKGNTSVTAFSCSRLIDAGPPWMQSLLTRTVMESVFFFFNPITPSHQCHVSLNHSRATEYANNVDFCQNSYNKKFHRHGQNKCLKLVCYCFEQRLK